MKHWSAYLKDTDSTELADMLQRFPTPAEYSTFYLFVDTHPNPIDAIDATQTNAEGEPEYTIEQLIALIDTHTGPGAVHVTRGQSQEIYRLLMPQLDGTE